MIWWKLRRFKTSDRHSCETFTEDQKNNQLRVYWQILIFQRVELKWVQPTNQQVPPLGWHTCWWCGQKWGRQCSQALQGSPQTDSWCTSWKSIGKAFVLKLQKLNLFDLHEVGWGKEGWASGCPLGPIVSPSGHSKPSTFGFASDFSHFLANEEDCSSLTQVPCNGKERWNCATKIRVRIVV